MQSWAPTCIYSPKKVACFAKSLNSNDFTGKENKLINRHIHWRLVSFPHILLETKLISTNSIFNKGFLILISSARTSSIFISNKGNAFFSYIFLGVQQNIQQLPVLCEDMKTYKMRLLKILVWGNKLKSSLLLYFFLTQNCSKYSQILINFRK